MNRCGVTSLLTAVVFAVGAFAMTSCGSPSVDRAALKQEILQKMQAEVGSTSEQAECFADTIDQFTDSELADLNASPVPQGVQDKLVTLLMPCLTGLSGSAAPTP
ncbi:MAG: hypothetical protein NT180_11130 [Actinobacteria bacterium]|nr:hypothetical protein [Actinomycetota bacterium]